MSKKRKRNTHRNMYEAWNDPEFQKWKDREMEGPLVREKTRADGEKMYALTGAGMVFCVKTLEKESCWPENWDNDGFVQSMPVDENLASIMATHMVSAADLWFEKNKDHERSEEFESLAALMALFSVVAQGQFDEIAEKVK